MASTRKTKSVSKCIFETIMKETISESKAAKTVCPQVRQFLGLDGMDSPIFAASKG